MTKTRMRTANLLAALTLAAGLVWPGVVGAQDVVKITLILEYMSNGGFTRTFEIVLSDGTVTYSSHDIALGDKARHWTTLQAKQALIAMGRGDLLRVFPGTEVAPKVLAQWAAEGYEPVYEFPNPKDRPNLKEYLPFLDIAGHWAYDAIVRMSEAGIIQGYPDGTFRPDKPVTRAEYVAMVRRITGAVIGSTVTAFVDVRGHWAEGEIAAVEHREWLRAGEYDAQRLRPDEPMPRQEMARLVARAAGLEGEAQALTGVRTTFIDNEAIGAAFRPYVKALADHGLIGGYPDGSFGPGRSLTRAEAATMLMRLMEHLKGTGGGNG